VKAVPTGDERSGAVEVGSSEETTTPPKVMTSTIAAAKMSIETVFDIIFLLRS
jgi:hypothetical protein